MDIPIGKYMIPRSLFSRSSEYINQVLRHHFPRNLQAEEEYVSYLKKEEQFATQYNSKYKEFREKYKPRQPERNLALQTPLIITIRERSQSTAYNDAVYDFYYLLSLAEEYDKVTESRQNQSLSQSVYANQPTGRIVNLSNFSSSLNGIGKQRSVDSSTNLSRTEHTSRRQQSLDSGLMHEDFKEIKSLSEENIRLKKLTEEQAQKIVQLQFDKREQQKSLEDLKTRLSGFASKQLVNGNPNFTDLSDKNRPIKLGEYFHAIYDDEWTNSLETLTSKRFKMSEEEGIHQLVQILKEIYQFCCGVATVQISETVMNILRPGFTDKKNLKEGVQMSKSEELQSRIQTIRREYCMEALPYIQGSFKDTNKLWKAYKNAEEVEKFINKCVEVIWLMKITDPPMVLKFAERAEILNTDLYNHYHKKGTKVAYCVWPAVLLHEEGAIISKGFAKPM